jgi:hypothetical protein
MNRHLTYANVVATLALVFAMSGGALAANHYLLSSSKQVSPSLLKKLKGRTGATGATGKAGANGPVGVAGAQGPAGKEGPSGSNGAPGSAVAFAHVTPISEPKAILDTANSKNVSAASEGQAGLYCISTTVPIKNVTGVTDLENETKHPELVSASFGLVPLAIALKVCPSSTTVLIDTQNTSGSGEKADFWVNFN